MQRKEVHTRVTYSIHKDAAPSHPHQRPSWVHSLKFMLQISAPRGKAITVLWQERGQV